MPSELLFAGPAPTAKDAGAWMYGEVMLNGRLSQKAAARFLKTFGDAFVYRNENRNWAIKPEVLAAFDELSSDDVVWSFSRRTWRKRRDTDKPGRQQR